MKFIRSTGSVLLLAFTAVALPMAAAAQTSTWKIDPVHSGVNFEIKHLAVANVRGSFTHPTGVIHLDENDITHSSVEATIETSTVNTNETKRDEHLKSPAFFDVQKFPTMTFKSTSFSKSSGKLQMTGDLMLNGVTKPVTLDVDGPAAPQKGMQGGIVSGFSASGMLHRSDFNFGSKYGPPMLSDAVKFTIDIEMDKQ